MSDVVEVVLRVPRAQEEQAVAQLLEISPGGFRCDDVGDAVEFGVYVPPGRAGLVRTYLARAGVDVQHERELDVPPDYAERWKEFHQPVLVGGMWVGPPWQLADALAGVRRVVIEPGQGFGTGAHPTTHLMLSLLHEQPRVSVLDVGTGSGVLAIAAVLLGFPRVTAVDHDEAAIDSARANLRRNDLAPSALELRKLDVLAEPLPPADVVLANLTLEPLRMLAPRLRAPRVVASGLLRSQVAEATNAFEAEGYVVRDRRDRDGWAALVLDNADERHATMATRPLT